MSLKAFHVAFITIATLAMALFGAWSVAAYLQGHQALHLGMAVFSIAAAAGLPVYGSWFLKKMRHVSYL